MFSSVSSFGDDLFLSYLLEFRAKIESSSNLLLRSFCIHSLKDFVDNLPDELLCPVCALRKCITPTASISPRPRSHFVSPHSPSHFLSKNAPSFFIRDLISQVSSSSGSSALSQPSTSSGSSRPSSSFRAHSVRTNRKGKKKI